MTAFPQKGHTNRHLLTAGWVKNGTLREVTLHAACFCFEILEASFVVCSENARWKQLLLRLLLFGADDHSYTDSFTNWVVATSNYGLQTPTTK